MKKWHVYLITFGFVLVCLVTGAQAGESRHRLGAGGHYWVTVDSIDLNNIDENGLAWLVSYQYVPPGLLKLEADLEIFPKEFAGAAKEVYAPQAYALVGGTIYGGVGVGIYYTDGEFASRPFYALRAGLELELLPSIFLDINANYRFEEWKNLSDIAEDIDTDTVTLGAVVRFEF